MSLTTSTVLPGWDPREWLPNGETIKNDASDLIKRTVTAVIAGTIIKVVFEGLPNYQRIADLDESRKLANIEKRNWVYTKQCSDADYLRRQILAKREKAIAEKNTAALLECDQMDKELKARNDNLLKLLLVQMQAREAILNIPTSHSLQETQSTTDASQKETKSGPMLLDLDKVKSAPTNPKLQLVNQTTANNNGAAKDLESQKPAIA